ncbi:MAG: response regulator [Treponema sp.]|nr:response regulator [Treponema sp.]
MEVMYKKLANQANLRRILVLAPVLALYLTTEFLQDLHKFFLPRNFFKFFEAGPFSVHVYLLFVILDGIFVITALLMLFISLLALQKLKNDQWQNLYYRIVQIYGFIITVCSFLAVMITVRSFGVADFTFAFILITVTSSLLYINSLFIIIVDALCFIISFVLITRFHLAFSYNPYWQYIIMFMIISTASTYIKEHHLRETVNRENAMGLFLANMSHEIRTPMNAIVGMSELAMDFNIGDNEKKTIQQIRSSGINLVEIVNDILDFSKISSGKMEIVPQTYDLIKLMNDVMNVVEVRLKGKPVELLLEIDPSLASKYYGDDVRIRQVLINLAGNASKFTEKGFIKLRVEDLSAYHEHEGIKFSVIDSGIGIKKEDIGKLFKAFQQVDMQMNRAKGGTGLGLSISKNLVSLMNGSIGVTSEYGKGSNFYIELPQKRMSDDTCGKQYKSLLDNAPQCAESPNLKQVSLTLINSPEYAYLFSEKISALPFTAPDAKVLVVDDNEVNLQVADGLLKKFNITCTTCLSGYKALELLKTQRFDIIFMDHQMPGMDGVETFEKIRAMESSLPDDKKTVVIVLSANAVNGAREMFLSRGFNDFVAKPVQQKELSECLGKWLKKELIQPLQNNPQDLPEDYDIPEDFPFLPRFQINVKEAVIAAGGFTNWLPLVKTFAASIQEKANLIQKYFDDNSFKNYTIQVHALKSAARIIGADRLSAMAAELEADGNNILKMEKISKTYILEVKPKNAALVAFYRSYTELLQPVQEYGNAVNTEKRDASDQEIATIIQALRNACSDSDLPEVESQFALLQQIQLPDSLNQKMAALSKAVEDIEFDQIEQLLAN